MSYHINNDILTTQEAALYLGVSTGSLRNSRHRFLLKGKKAPKYIKEGRFVFYKKEDLDEWKSYPISNPIRSPWWDYKNNKKDI